ncbi:hypothetical protein FOMPIDRAFT_92811 [Fomitopsis schrenkii]|uniref:DUF7918 domain-containing protein n=1 Tax=Fomitopsis schrenkii TaxID=2126942 RepID=S8F9D2_FOMSC|nr:hypothetical protein FOMPIDRAFT_92811 [Fomitopsis schrenkii]
MLSSSLNDSLDDEEAAKDLACEGQLGEIQTRIVRVEPGEPIEWTPSTVNETQNFGVIHESVKKVGMHCVSFGATVPIPRRKVYNVVYIDKVSSPYITFTFRYRPRAILQAEGIIEPDPIPDRQPTRSPRSPTEPLPPRETRSPTARGESLEAEHLREQPDEPSPSTRPKKRRRRGRPSSTSAESPDGDASPVAKPEDEATPSVKEEDDVEDVDALEAQLSAIRQRIDRARANQTGRSGSRVIKRESSPIRVGRFHGGIIDLTDD